MTLSIGSRVPDFSALTTRGGNWTWGDDVIIVPSVSDDEARLRFPDGWHAVTPYLRVVSQPGD